MTSSFAQYEHWQVQSDQEGIVWLSCDRAGERVNSLSEAVITELDRILDEIERLHEPLSLSGVVVQSAKKQSFIVGADIREFDAFDHAHDVEQKIAQGQAVFSRLENLSLPTVAAVHGHALGGGLELALCCDYLCVLDVPETRLGFPEVKLGIFPALGGVTRLTEKLGGPAAMNLMLTGRMLRASAARSMGLADESVSAFASLRWAARRAVLQRRRARKPTLVARLSNRQPLRTPLAALMRRKTAEKANPLHYPAPFQMIDLWAQHRDNRRRMFAGEAQRVGALMTGETARHLRRLFFLTERMKALGKNDQREFRRVHVIGAGVMGGDIAAWCVVQGLEVTLQDQSMARIDPALKRADALFSKRLKRRPAILAARSRLIADVQGQGVPRADLIIEAIFEDADAKRALYAELEPRMADDAVLATNTSALPLESLARDLQRPERFVGLHFFNPVARMPLVEVIHSESTDTAALERACAFCNHINRFPLPTRSAPGFLVNRVLAPYLMEAFTMLLEGIDQERIDASAVQFGMPMGPVELADVVGLDVCMKVAETLAHGDVSAQRRLLQEKLDGGHLGKKTGQGFYRWSKGKAEHKAAVTHDADQEQLGRRLIRPLLAECQAASAEGIVSDDELLDAGVVFGAGFAPFRGGPMQYLKTLDHSVDVHADSATGSPPASTTQEH